MEDLQSKTIDELEAERMWKLEFNRWEIFE